MTSGAVCPAVANLRRVFSTRRVFFDIIRSMNWKKYRFIFPLSAAVAVFFGYWLFALDAFTPEMSREVAVACGVRPAADVFPGLWRYAAGPLPPVASSFSLVGRILASVFAVFLYLLLRRAMMMLHRVSIDADRINDFFIPFIALVCAVMGSFAEPIWRAFSLFAPASLTLLFVVVTAYLHLAWIERGGWWRLCGGLFLMGLFAAETPLALVMPVACFVVYWMLWRAIRNDSYRPRNDLPTFGGLPKWRMLLSFVAGLLVGGAAIINFVSVRDAAGTLGWKFTYVLFHYWQQYLILAMSSSVLSGWVLGIPLCVIPFIVVSRMTPILTDDYRPMSFILGVAALFCGLIAYFEQGPLRGAWFWTWIGDKDLVSSVALLGFYSVLSTCAFAFVALIFVADAFNVQRSEDREPGVIVTYRWSMVVLTVVVAGLIVFRMPHTNVRKILLFNDNAIKETIRELNGAKYLFTDGSADAELELEAARQGKTLYTINLMVDSAKNAEALRLRGLTDEGDIIAAKMGASALLRVWACDKQNGLDDAALQIGLELWKRESGLAQPEASAFLARTKGLRPEDVRDASLIANTFAEHITELTPVADASDVPPSVRELFFTLSWRISRFARYRKDSELADKLDSMNSALKRMLRDLEYARLQVFLQMTPKEGLELALRRADFQDAARYAAAVLKIDKDDPRGNFGMGMYFLMANRYEDAETYLRRVLIRRPAEPAALNNLSIICRKTRRYEEAVKLAKQALDILPDNEDVKQTLKDAENKAP